MTAIPVTGVLGAGYQRSPLLFFGIELPRWAAADRSRAHSLFEVHSILVWVTVALLVLHVLGGLKHLFIDRDAVFQRMWLRRG